MDATYQIKKGMETNKEKGKEKEKEKCVSSLDDVLQDISCNIKREMIENNHCVTGALTRSVLKTSTAFLNCKLTQFLENVAPGWLMN